MSDDLRDRPAQVSAPRDKGPLTAAETADAAITAALIVALLAAGRVLAAGSMFQVVASFVVAVLAARRRTRVVVIAAAAAAAIALILGGLGPVSQAALAGVFGWCGGQSLRRGWGRTRSVLFTLAIGWPAMAASVMFFYPAIAINRKLRELVFENVENQADGLANILGGLGGLFGAVGLGFVENAANSVGSGLQRIADFLIDNWLLLIPATELVYATIYALAIRALGGAILRRLERSLVDPVEADIISGPTSDPSPVPLRVHPIPLRRNGTIVNQGVDVVVGPGEHVVIQGPNGAGKSTLLDAMAGLHNDDAVEHTGSIGLGRIGGTARVGQRPEAQVVGTTVEEDLRWGLDGHEVDVASALSSVGLSAIEPDRPSSELSGGELQRLALASALQRQPELLLADEITSMLDPDEQQRIIERLHALEQTAIVRTTHRNDATASDRTVRLSATKPIDPTSAEPVLRTIRSSATDARLLRLQHVGYAHNHDKPWAHEVLRDINLSVHRYEMIVVEGRNGSGKTTLARLLAGIDDPTTGEVDRAKGVRRAMAHQHARLQLLKATVIEELHSLCGIKSDGTDVDADEQRQRTRATNLQTSIEIFRLGDLLDRRIDELSGGEQRRVLLAGLVSRGVSVLVLDEPLAGLDVEGRQDLANTLEQVRLAGTSVIVVSHDVDWSPPMVSQRLRLADGTLHQVER